VSSMIVYGGQIGELLTTERYKYAIASNKWIFETSIPSNQAPKARQYHSAVTAVNTNVMVAYGGSDVSNLELSDVAEYNLLTQKWNTITVTGTPPNGRWAHSAVICGSNTSMYVYGGVAFGSTLYSDLWLYNTTARSWTEITPTTTGAALLAVQSHTAVCGTFGGAPVMIVFGGVDNILDVRYNQTHRFHPSTGVWETNLAVTGVVPPARYSHSAVVINNQMIVFGGSSTDSEDFQIFFNDTWIFDIATSSWSQVFPTGSIPTMFLHRSIATYRNTMLVYGGQKSEGNTVGNQIYEFDAGFGGVTTAQVFTTGTTQGQFTTGTTAAVTTATPHGLITTAVAAGNSNGQKTTAGHSEAFQSSSGLLSVSAVCLLFHQLLYFCL